MEYWRKRARFSIPRHSTLDFPRPTLGPQSFAIRCSVFISSSASLRERASVRAKHFLDASAQSIDVFRPPHDRQECFPEK